MHAALGTLTSVTGCTAAVVVGAFVGSRPAVRNRPLPWLGRLQLAALMALILSLGIKLGADEEVIASLGQIGLSAFAITVAAMAGSVAALTLLRRFVLKLDRFGLPLGSGGGSEDSHGDAQKADNSLTKWIVGAVALGMLAGYFIVPASVVQYCGTVIDVGL